MKKLFEALFGRNKGSVTINGVRYEGNNISINQHGVTIDGDLCAGTSVGNNVHLTVVVEGDCDKVQTMSGDVTVHGNVGHSVETMSGDVTAQSISGPVKTMSGDVNVR